MATPPYYQLDDVLAGWAAWRESHASRMTAFRALMGALVRCERNKPPEPVQVRGLSPAAYYGEPLEAVPRLRRNLRNDVGPAADRGQSS